GRFRSRPERWGGGRRAGASRAKEWNGLRSKGVGSGVREGMTQGSPRCRSGGVAEPPEQESAGGSASSLRRPAGRREPCQGTERTPVEARRKRGLRGADARALRIRRGR